MTEHPTGTDAHEQIPHGLSKMINDCVEGTVVHATGIRRFYLQGIGVEKDVFLDFFCQFSPLIQFTAGLMRGEEAGKDIVDRSIEWLETDISGILFNSKTYDKSPLKAHALKGISLSTEYLGQMIAMGIISTRK